MKEIEIQLSDIKERVARIEERTEAIPDIKKSLDSLKWKVAGISAAVAFLTDKAPIALKLFLYKMGFWF